MQARKLDEARNIPRPINEKAIFGSETGFI
jgi:hypothetical protein